MNAVKIDDIVLTLLLFADDMAILTIEDSRRSADKSSYITYVLFKLGLEVSTTKTKIMDFRNRGTLLRNERWLYNGVAIEVVDNFNYLGTVIRFNSKFLANQEYIVGKSLKALNTLLANRSRIKLQPKILCELFDSFVGSILGYSSEVSGVYKSDDIERIHLKFCKRILNVRSNTCTAGVYGELGRYPLFITRYVRIIK